MIVRCAYVLASVLLLVLEGCSGACTTSGVEGVYGLSLRGVDYALRLQAGGRATLSVSQKTVGDLRWTLADGPGGQILELDAAGDVYKTLSTLTSARAPPANPIVVYKGVVASEPVCSRSGRLSKLVVDYDSGLAFRPSEKGFE